MRDLFELRRLTASLNESDFSRGATGEHSSFCENNVFRWSTQRSGDAGRQIAGGAVAAFRSPVVSEPVTRLPPDGGPIG